MSQQGKDLRKRPSKVAAVANAGSNTPTRAFSTSFIQQNTDWSQLPLDILQHKISPHLETSLPREVCSKWANGILAPYIYLTPERIWDEDTQEDLQNHFVCARGIKLMGLAANRCISILECLLRHLDSIEGASSVREIYFFRCNLGAQLAKTLGTVLRHPQFHLEVIRVFDSTVSVEVADAFGEALKKESPTLQKIIGSAGVAGRSIAPSLAKNTSLVYIGFRGLHTADGAGPKLAEALKQNSTLASLDLRDSAMTFVGIDAFMECLGSNKGLQVFKLSSNLRATKYQKSRLGETSGVAAASLGTNSTLTYLDLSFTPLPTEFYKHFADGLAKNKTLKSLILVDSNCNSPQIKLLSPAISVHPALEKLDISQNMINSDGGEPFTQALVENKSLKKLKLLETKATATVVFNLFNALVDKPNFSSLAISKGHIDSDVIQAFESLIDSDTPIHHLEISEMFFKNLKDVDAVVDLITASTTIKSFKCDTLVNGISTSQYERQRTKKYDCFDKLVEIAAIPGLKKIYINAELTPAQNEIFERSVLQQTELRHLHIHYPGSNPDFLIKALDTLPLQTLSADSPGQKVESDSPLLDALKRSKTLQTVKMRWKHDAWSAIIPHAVSLRSFVTVRDNYI
jgi:hypothetical protein